MSGSAPDDPDRLAAARRWQAVSALLDEALDLPAAERADWLAALDARDATLASEVRRLLDAHATAGPGDALSSLPSLGPRRAPDASHGLQPGQRVGPWVLVSLLGTGGMAVVWHAQRADGAYQRDVALKLPQRLPWRDDLAERLARERDILARLEHPHIARLYDAGVATGQNGAELPWLAMERIHGRPLTEWCDSQRLSPRERIKLFLQVLDAVAHAHAALVLHRDLKPSNILVNEAGEVKLLDFGIAKLLDAEGATTTDTRLTELGGRALTPDYASPEQVRGDPLTTASDVYALGVLLYELLSGERPYRLRHRSAAQLEAAVLEGRITRPSTRPGAAAAEARGLSPRRLSRLLRGELDAIVLAALRAAPAERYAGAVALRADLERWLDGLPMQARADSRWYRSKRFVQRHRVGVAMTAAVLLLLAGTTAVSIRQSQLAEREAARARASRDFLAGLYRPLSWLSDNPARGQQVTARELLDLSAARLKTQPVTDADVHRDAVIALADLYADIGAAVPAEALASSLVAHVRTHFGAESAEHFDALVRWSLTLNAINLKAASQALAQAEPLLPRVPPEEVDMLVRYWLARGNLSEDSDQARAEQAFSEAIRLLKDRPDRVQTYSRALTGLARVRWLGQNRLAEARTLYEQALAALAADPDTPAFWLTKPQAELADVLTRLGDFRGARSLYQQAHERSHSGLGAAHTDTVQTGLRLAQVRRATGEPLAALALLDRLQTDLAQASKGEDVYTLPSVHRERGETRFALGDWAGARSDFEAALQGLAKRGGSQRISDASVLWTVNLAMALAAAGQPDAAHQALAEAEQGAGSLGDIPRVARALARGRAVLKVLSLGPGANSQPAEQALDAWQRAEQALSAGAAPALQARTQAGVLLWRAHGRLFAGQAAAALSSTEQALGLLSPEVLAQIGELEQGQLMALQAEALWRLGRPQEACRSAAEGQARLARLAPQSPEAGLLVRLSSACRIPGATMSPTATPALAGAPWQTRRQGLP